MWLHFCNTVAALPDTPRLNIVEYCTSFRRSSAEYLVLDYPSVRFTLLLSLEVFHHCQFLQRSCMQYTSIQHLLLLFLSSVFAAVLSKNMVP